jgi:hypothetical protein
MIKETFTKEKKREISKKIKDIDLETTIINRKLTDINAERKALETIRLIETEKFVKTPEEKIFKEEKQETTEIKEFNIKNSKFDAITLDDNDSYSVDYVVDPIKQLKNHVELNIDNFEFAKSEMISIPKNFDIRVCWYNNKIPLITSEDGLINKYEYYDVINLYNNIIPEILEFLNM